LSENLNEDEGLSNLVISKVSTLCQDLVEEDDIPLGVDEHVELLKLVVRGKKTRQRSI
jgi:hypothetical protein